MTITRRRPRRRMNYYASKGMRSAERAELRRAAKVSGIGDEIALLRAELKKKMEEEGEKLEVLRESIEALGRAVAIQHKLSPSPREDPAENMAAVLESWIAHARQHLPVRRRLTCQHAHSAKGAKITMTTKIDGDHAVAKIKPGTHVKVLGPDGNVQDEFTADRNLVVVKTEEFKKAVAGYLRLLDELQSVLFNVRELILEEQEAVGQDELDEATEINARWYKFFSDEVVPRVSAARPRK